MEVYSRLNNAIILKLYDKQNAYLFVLHTQIQANKKLCVPPFWLPFLRLVFSDFVKNGISHAFSKIVKTCLFSLLIKLRLKDKA
jgi:hypothetical protein